MASILVTGGAGYIGSHVCKALHARGHVPVTYDNLVRGHRGFVKWGPLEVGDIRDEARLDAVIAQYRPQACVHLAAFAYIGESFAEPLAYYDNNVLGSLSLVRGLTRGGVRKLLFSSTCAVYGVPERVPVSEAAVPNPINPYGRTKLAVERMIADVAATGALDFGILRYFNAAGGDPDGEVGETHDPEPHLIPTVIARVVAGEPVAIFGDDYPTDDGTCIRDYIHVTDLADAHVRALAAIDGGERALAVNLGTGRGHSVRSIAHEVGRLTGKPVRLNITPRRQGDPPVLVAAADRARELLGWQPTYSDLETILRTAIAWHRKSRA